MADRAVKDPQNVAPSRLDALKAWLRQGTTRRARVTRALDRLDALVDRIERETLPFHFPRTAAEWDALTAEQRAIAAIQDALRDFYAEEAP